MILAASTPSEKKRWKQGFIMPLVILGVISVAFLVTFVHFMSRGYSTQIEHQDEFFRAKVLAESLLAKVQARLHTKRWEERFFFPKPYYESGVSESGGSFELYVIDSPGKAFQLDIYAQTKFKRASRLFFWRLRHETSILDAAGRSFPLIFTATAPQTLNTGTSPLGNFIDKLLITKKENAPKAAEKAATIKQLSSTKDIQAALDGPTDADVFSEDIPVNELPPPSSITSPPPTPTTTVYTETFDGIGEGDSLIPGFSVIGNQSGSKGRIVKTKSSTPPNSYEIENGSNQRMPISISNRLVYEFDILITKPDNGSTDRNIYLGPSYGLGASNALLYNVIRFNSAEKRVYFTSDVYSPNSSSAYVCDWKMDRFSRIRVDLNFDELTADVYVDSNKVVDRFPIQPKSLNRVDPETGENVVATLNGFEVHGHTSPYCSYIDNLNIAK